MGFLLKNLVYSIGVTGAFYILLLTGDAFGLRQAQEQSFSLLSVIITLITFNFSVANIRVK